MFTPLKISIDLCFIDDCVAVPRKIFKITRERNRGKKGQSEADNVAHRNPLWVSRSGASNWKRAITALMQL